VLRQDTDVSEYLAASIFRVQNVQYNNSVMDPPLSETSRESVQTYDGEKMIRNHYPVKHCECVQSV